MKHDFQYISKDSPKVAAAYRNLMLLLSDVRQELRETYTFQHRLVGSYARNFITFDRKGNTGYDFDVDIYPNAVERYSAKELKQWFKNALNRCGKKYGYAPAEDSTRVLTIKIKDRANARILHSIDFAIVRDDSDGWGNPRQQYIRYNKNHRSYTWEYQSNGYEKLPEKIEQIKQECRWQEVRDRYLEKKNSNDDPNSHSRTLFAMAVHEVFQRLDGTVSTDDRKQTDHFFQASTPSYPAVVMIPLLSYPGSNMRK